MVLGTGTGFGVKGGGSELGGGGGEGGGGRNVVFTRRGENGEGKGAGGVGVVEGRRWQGAREGWLPNVAVIWQTGGTLPRLPTPTHSKHFMHV